MSLAIPQVIHDYFNAANRHDVDGVVRCFNTDAVVHDEGRHHAGHAEIRKWNDATSKEYKAIVTPVSARSDGAKSTVECQVSGDFAGSPVALQFAFVLARGGIDSLEVTA